MIFNQILIVDSIPARERNTARELHLDVVLRAQVFQGGPEVRYRRVESMDAFSALLAELTAQAPRQIPVLHVECHGDDEGLQFADGSVARWAELKPSLTALNVATRLNLLIVVAACRGRSIVRTLTLHDRAPFHGLIGAVRNIYPMELERGFLAFYETLFATRSARDAVAALRQAVPDTFVYWSAEWLFQRIWHDYHSTHETPEARRERARRNVANPPEGFEGVHVTEEQFVRMLEQQNRPFFDACRRLFFLCDLFPEHESAFPVSCEPHGERLSED